MGPSRLRIKPETMATGTTWMPPDFWMTGRVKSSAVAPP